MSETIGDRFAAWLKKVALKVLFSDEMKRKLLVDLNGKINIPILDEKAEAELFEIMWDYMEEGFKKHLK